MLLVSWCVRILRLHRSLLAIFHRAEIVTVRRAAFAERLIPSWLPVGLSGGAFGLRSLYSDIEEPPILSSEAKSDGGSLWESVNRAHGGKCSGSRNLELQGSGS